MNGFKKFLFMIWNSFWMSASYGLVFLVFAAFIAICSWIGLQLLEGTIDNPILFYPIDGLVVIALIYLFTRKRLRDGLREFWKQILKSY